VAAEASHSLADTANDLFLLVAQRRSTRRRDQDHPFGYGQVWVLVRINVAADLHTSEITALARGIEAGMKAESSSVYRVDVVPIGEDQSA
jgi:divalent metal cation (Fe/Co/Zn/Cd) transporter